mmetsp:Transcript_123369/g.308181  ORF Transcript_123369/g.308181 Transcript_123369/m.308181 type:complete len:302 (-) Transcript_123369:23-928(-)
MAASSALPRPRSTSIPSSTHKAAKASASRLALPTACCSALHSVKFKRPSPSKSKAAKISNTLSESARSWLPPPWTLPIPCAAVSSIRAGSTAGVPSATSPGTTDGAKRARDGEFMSPASSSVQASCSKFSAGLESVGVLLVTLSWHSTSAGDAPHEPIRSSAEVRSRGLPPTGVWIANSTALLPSGNEGNSQPLQSSEPAARSGSKKAVWCAGMISSLSSPSLSERASGKVRAVREHESPSSSRYLAMKESNPKCSRTSPAIVSNETSSALEKRLLRTSWSKRNFTTRAIKEKRARAINLS